MKSFSGSVAVLAFFIMSAADPVHARNVKLTLAIDAAMKARADSDAKPTGAVKFFFGTQNPPAIVTRLGSYIARPRTSAMGMRDDVACNGAFLWTLLALEKRAQQVGANAVVNIVSFYKNNEMSSVTEFECHVGNVIARVVLKGDLVKIAEP